jgi:hypothetical protein
MNTISKNLWRKARTPLIAVAATAFALVAALTMGGGLFQSSGTAFADTSIIFTGGGDIIFTGGGGSVGGNQVLGLDKHCDHHAAEAAKKDAEAAKIAAKNGKHSDEQAAKKAAEAAKQLQKFHDCLARFVVADVLNAPDPQAEAAAVGLDLEESGISGDSLTWDSIKWSSIKWSAIQLDSIKWSSIKWSGGAGDIGLQ